MKRFILALNFKNNLVNSADYIKSLSAHTQKTKVIVLPSYLQIGEFALKTKEYELGSQNVQQSSQTLTGAISAEMLKNYNVKYCLVGHSERQENINSIADKIVQLVNKNITPILCVGEKEKMDTKSSILTIKKVFDNLVKLNIDLSKILVAYEPEYMIGAEEICSIEHIEKMISYLKQNYNFLGAIYGGSVNLKNYEEISKISGLDGFLIGKCSLNAKNIKKMIDFFEK